MSDDAPHVPRHTPGSRMEPADIHLPHTRRFIPCVGAAALFLASNSWVDVMGHVRDLTIGLGFTAPAWMEATKASAWPVWLRYGLSAAAAATFVWALWPHSKSERRPLWPQAMPWVVGLTAVAAVLIPASWPVQSKNYAPPVAGAPCVPANSALANYIPLVQQLYSFAGSPIGCPIVAPNTPDTIPHSAYYGEFEKTSAIWISVYGRIYIFGSVLQQYVRWR
jgi:hypothetical protein